MQHPLETIRFQPEADLIDELFHRFSLEAIVRNYEESGQGAPSRELVVSTQLRLTPLLAPRLYALFEEVKTRLAYAEPVELFVQADSNINGFSLHSLGGEQAHVVSLTSGMIERMSDDELRFVLGHELGHLHFKHHRPRLVYAVLMTQNDDQDEQGSRVPPLLQRRLETWERLAELSADRAGFFAVEGRLQPVVSAFFKLISGLGPEHLRFDIAAFLNQLEDLQQMKRRDVLARFSHPATPVRVRALQLYGEAAGSHIPEAAHPLLPAVRKDVDEHVASLARLMEYEVSEPLDVHARDFLLAAGLLAAHAGDGAMSREEHELLVQMLLPLTADPEEAFERVSTEDAAEGLLLEATAWLKENAGEERFALYRHIAHLVAVDGVLDSDEKAFMLQLARMLDIPLRAATRLLYDVLADYLQSRPWDRKLNFRTRKAKKVRSSRRAKVPPEASSEARK